MRKVLSLLAIAFLLIQAHPAEAMRLESSGAKFAPQRQAADYSDKIKKIEAFVKSQMKSESSVGLTIGFIKDDFRWVKGFGYADLENKVSTHPLSSYRTASVAKPMTAVAILTLVEQGKIDLDAEVQKYVPYFPKKKYPVRIRQLLGHLGGISHYKNYDLEGHFKYPKNTRESIAVFEKFDLIAEPGTRYSYSSYGFNLLGAVIEGASGKSYGDYMAENVFKPLNMKNTLLDDPLEIISNRVKGYQLINGKVKHSEFVDISSRFAAGGLRSTVPDMLNFAKGLYEGKVLTAESRNAMWTSQVTKAGEFVGYGYGWVTSTGNGRFIVAHSGGQAETRTYLLVVPNRKFAAAVAINSESAYSSNYARKLFEIVTEEPWQISQYAQTPRDVLLLRGIDRAFDNGLRHYNQFGKPRAYDDADLAEAFAYFKEAWNAPTDRLGSKFARGNHPVANEAFIKIVSHIADTFVKAGKNLDAYYQTGAIPFFNDYIKWYKTQPASYGFRFNQDIENRIQRWNSDWAATWNKTTRNLNIGPSMDFGATTEVLRKMFAGRSVYPNFVSEFDDLVVSFAVSGNTIKAFGAAQANQQLYPNSHITNATLGILLSVAGRNDQAKSLLKKSLMINPRGDAGARNLNATAYNLDRIRMTEGGLRLLLLAVELHPKDANLYDSIGEFYLKLKQNEKAIEYYKKALSIDPKYPNAANATKTIEKLK